MLEQRVKSVEMECATTQTHSSSAHIDESRRLDAELAGFEAVERENDLLHAQLTKLQYELNVAESQFTLLDEQTSTESHHWKEKMSSIGRGRFTETGSQLYGELLVYRALLKGGIGEHKGLIEFAELDLDCHYIVLQNVTHREIQMSGWQVKQWKGHSASGNHAVKFQIPNGIVLGAGRTLKIWARGGVSTHSPLQIVAEEVHEWCPGNAITHLYDDRNSEQAKFMRLPALEELEFR